MLRPARAEGAPRFAPVIDYMRAHLSRRLTLEELAREAGLSPFHFLRSFQAHCHATPQQMLMALRLFEAKRRLAAGEPPAQVALAAGLTDQAHLTGLRPALRRHARALPEADARLRPRIAEQAGAAPALPTRSRECAANARAAIWYKTALSCRR